MDSFEPDADSDAKNKDNHGSICPDVDAGEWSGPGSLMPAEHVFYTTNELSLSAWLALLPHSKKAPGSCPGWGI